MAGAQAAQACTEPTLGDLAARAQEDKLVRFELNGLTPGSEYLLKVNDRERKSGVAASDKVSRRFRMPHMGDSNRRVTVSVIVANDGCENSPWKLEEKMTYRPEPEPQARPEQPQAQPTPSPSPSPAPAPDSSPSPPPAPSPPVAPSITDTPKSQPDVPAPTVKPTVPTPPTPSSTEPEKDAKTWLTPLDPYARGDNPPPKVSKASLARTDLPSDDANSTAALLGLAGVFLLMVGIAGLAWGKFRRYDDERLAEVLNPEGKLPTHLDPNAEDVVAGEALAQRKGLKRLWVIPLGFLRRKPKLDITQLGKPGPKLTDEEKATLSPEEQEKLKEERRRLNKIAGRKSGRRKAPLPTSDPTAAPAAQGGAPGPGKAAAAAAGAAAGAAAAKAGAGDEPKRKRFGFLRRKPKLDITQLGKPGPKLTDEEKATLSPEEQEKLKEERRRQNKIAMRKSGRRKAALPTSDPTAPPPAEAANGKPAPEVVPPVAPPQANGVPGARPAPLPPQANGVPEPPTPPPPVANGQPPQRSYRDQVEGELQRILNDAGLHAEVDGILSDAKAEAERQGVPIDSELILRALCDDANGAAKLSESTRGELESRFKRIVAEERGEQRG